MKISEPHISLSKSASSNRMCDIALSDKHYCEWLTINIRNSTLLNWAPHKKYPSPIAIKVEPKTLSLSLSLDVFHLFHIFHNLSAQQYICIAIRKLRCPVLFLVKKKCAADCEAKNRVNQGTETFMRKDSISRTHGQATRKYHNHCPGVNIFPPFPRVPHGFF